MHKLTRTRAAVLIALFAALAQLWLGTLHASIGGSAVCSGGSGGISAELLQQLPPELRVPVDRLDDSVSGSCPFCGTACMVALPAPVPPVAFLHVLRPRARPVVVVSRPVTAARIERPPVRGPPAAA